MKMGSPSVNHGHMDVGSFLLEADGVLWGMDMGGEEYNRLETRGGLNCGIRARILNVGMFTVIIIFAP